IDEILERLPPQVTLNVPDHILSRWFPPGPVNGVMEGAALVRAQSYAQSCACRFAYHGSVREGDFYKPVPSDDCSGKKRLHPCKSNQLPADPSAAKIDRDHRAAQSDELS